MTTIQQQIDFVQELRDKWDESQRERITIARDPQTVATLLRDIQENLIATKRMQLNQEVVLCSQCNQPGKQYELLDEVLCDRCAQTKLERINSTVGIP